MDSAPELIDRREALQRLASHLANAPTLAIDTEFVWERTYYPRPGLVQLATADGAVYLVDTVAIPDLAPLGGLLASPDCCLILHDAQQDLTLLRRAAGVFPRCIFDTRLAAGFCGMSAEQSLQALLQTALEITLPKGLTRSDWCARPLRPELLAYAADDVLHMHRLREVLLREAQAHGNSDRLAEDLGALDNPALYADPKPRRQYQRLKGANGLPPAALAVLRELAAWRELRAREADRPRRWILADNALIELASRQPADAAALRQCRSIPGTTAQRQGDALLACIRKGLAVPEARHPRATPRQRPPAPERQRVEACITALQDQARRLAIDPFLVGARAELTDWFSTSPPPTDGRLSTGWRHALLCESEAANPQTPDPQTSHQDACDGPDPAPATDVPGSGAGPGQRATRP